MKIAILGPIEGPVGGQNRLTRAFRDGTRFQNSFYEFVGHNRWYGPFILIMQVIRCLYTAIFWRPDVIYVSVSRSNFGMFRDLALMLPLKLSGAPIVAHVHGAEFDEFYLVNSRFRSVKNFYMRIVNEFIFVNEVFVPVGTDLEGRSTAIRNPIPAFVVRYLENQKSNTPTQLNSRPVFGFISTFAKEKGIELFLDVSEEFSDRADFIVAGGPAAEDVAYGQEMLSRVIESSAIEYLGYLKDPTDFYTRADFMVFPTSFASETSSLVVIEALATKTTPLVRKHNQLVNVFKGAPIGWFDDLDSLRVLMETMLATSSDVLAKNRESAVPWVLDRFPTEKRWVEAVDQIVFKAIKRNNN